MIDIEALAWDKMNGLLPAVVQHAGDSSVLMLGYMNREALQATVESGFVTFFSRSKGRLWRKGETSGNVLMVQEVQADCDRDALLIRAKPAGPTCHLGTSSCFGVGGTGPAWLATLEQIIAERAAAATSESYTARLLGEGPTKVAQKVGEEGVELSLALVARDDAGVVEEAADLLYHLLVGLRLRELSVDDVVATLRSRHENASRTNKLTMEER